MFERKPPIRSTQEDVAELAEELDRFVIALAERIDSIQDAELANCWSDVASLARTLANDAERLGYPGMSQNAKSVAMAAEDAKAEVLQDAIVDVTELGQRIRRGHRGAA
jgi:hypothetical protein